MSNNSPSKILLFADRLEIYTPGALPNSLTIDSITRISAPRNEVITNLFAQYYPVEDPVFGKNQLMDKRGAGVGLILKRSEALSSRKPVYENISDMELKLAIYAAPPPPDKAEAENLNPTPPA